MRDIFWLCSPNTMNEVLAYDEALQEKGIFDLTGNYDIILGDMAIITCFGTLYNHPSHTQKYTGGRDYRTLIDLRKKYTFNNTVKKIVYCYNSPGGEAVGCQEAIAFYHTCEILKPSIALISGYCCSAATNLAVTSSRVLLSSQTDVMGSVTGICWRDKKSENFEVISTGELKAPQQRERSSILDDYIKTILNHISKICLMSIKLERKLSIEQTQRLIDGGLFFGQDAIDVGLADGFYSPFAWHSSRQVVENPMEVEGEDGK